MSHSVMPERFYRASSPYSGETYGGMTDGMLLGNTHLAPNQIEDRDDHAYHDDHAAQL